MDLWISFFFSVWDKDNIIINVTHSIWCAGWLSLHCRYISIYIYITLPTTQQGSHLPSHCVAAAAAPGPSFYFCLPYTFLIDIF